MEIIIHNPTQGQPLPPVEWNYAEVKQWVKDGLSRYEGIVYDDSQMAEAKKDRANLNKLAQAIDGKRREMKQMYLQPYDEFEAQAKELTGMIKDQAGKIDAQIKAVEDLRKQEKLERIKAEMYAPMIGNLAELVPYERLHESRWLNVTCSPGTISEELGGKIDKITAGLNAIGKLDMEPDLIAHARDTFLKHFDLAASLDDVDRVKKQREALERRDVAEAAKNGTGAQRAADLEKIRGVEEKRSDGENCGNPAKEGARFIKFGVWATTEQLQQLRAAMDQIGIKPERII